jgi:sugar/nucleoside kinase (ribokinase family)
MALNQLDVLVVGGANTDFLVRGPSLPRPGSTIEGDEFQEGPGGKGANQAVAAARLGGKVALIARVGSDRRGEMILACLDQERVDAHAVVQDRQAPTGVALVMVDTSGAGDAFAAALAVYLACGEGLEAAAHFANAAAALKATKLGAQAGLPRREEVLRLLRPRPFAMPSAII